MLNKIKNYALVFLVTALCLVFVIQFGGPQAQGCTSTDSPFVAKVYGDTITLRDFEAVAALSNLKRYPPNIQQALNIPELILDGMIDARLLAHEARAAGLRMLEHEVMENFARDSRVYVSLGVDAPSFIAQGEFPVDLNDKDGNFDPKFAKQYIKNYLGWSVSEFAAAQADEVLAKRFRELVAMVLPVREEAAWEQYVSNHDSAVLSYVVFSHSDDYKADVAMKDAKSILEQWKSGLTDQALAEKLKKLPNFKKDPVTATVQKSDTIYRSAPSLLGMSSPELTNAIFNTADEERFCQQPFADEQQTLIFRIDERSRPERQAFTGDMRVASAEQVRVSEKSEALRVLIYSLRDEAQKRDALALRPELVKIPEDAAAN